MGGVLRVFFVAEETDRIETGMRSQWYDGALEQKGLEVREAGKCEFE